MPYKTKEARRLNDSKKVESPCCVCGKPAFARNDTLKKFKRITCSAECKSKLISECQKNEINESDFIKEYLCFELGLQKLAQKFNIGYERAINILNNNNIKILTADEIRVKKRENNSGNWLKSEVRICKKCGKHFKFRKGSTVGFFCSHLCYMQYSGRTGIEISIAKLLTELQIEFKEQFKIKSKYYDFYLPVFNVLIECDGDYWHSLEKNKQNDIVKNKLAENSGIKLIRFTEFDINNNLEKIKEVLCCLKL